ncbi:MAG: GTPase Era [Deltaproteobacteria bacterium]|nr:GTPase Era [Deltaproteobacteria bacterium]
MSEAPPSGAHRAGFVALIGQPNVGKSTLLNQILGERIAIVTHKPQTTRTRVLGVAHDPGWQIAFLDTPGVHPAKGGLNRYMVDVALSTLDEVEAVLFLVDVSHRLPAEALSETGEALDRALAQKVAFDERDAKILERLVRSGKPVVLGVNKVDAVHQPYLLPLIESYQAVHDWKGIHPISARTGEGLADLMASLAGLMPESPPLFPPDMLTDQAERTIAAEYVREQVMRHVHQEIPYETAVEILLFDEEEREGKGLVRIEANIVVDRASQKGIIIGKKGAMISRIGKAARLRLEKLLGARVYLGLNVRVEPGWSRKAGGLRKMGYT